MGPKTSRSAAREGADATREVAAPPEVVEAFSEAERADGVVVTPAQLAHWAETGEWPDASD